MLASEWYQEYRTRHQNKDNARNNHDIEMQRFTTQTELYLRDLRAQFEKEREIYYANLGIWLQTRQGDMPVPPSMPLDLQHATDIRNNNGTE
jgi:hypothetical protein